MVYALWGGARNKYYLNDIGQRVCRRRYVQVLGVMGFLPAAWLSRCRPFLGRCITLPGSAGGLPFAGEEGFWGLRK